MAAPNDVNLAEKLIDVTEKKSKAEQELLEDPEVELVMTLDKKYLHSNAHLWGILYYSNYVTDITSTTALSLLITLQTYF